MKEACKRANDTQIMGKEVHMAQTLTNIRQELVLRKSPQDCLPSPLSGASSGARELLQLIVISTMILSPKRQNLEMSVKLARMPRNRYHVSPAPQG